MINFLSSFLILPPLSLLYYWQLYTLSTWCFYYYFFLNALKLWLYLPLSLVYKFSIIFFFTFGIPVHNFCYFFCSWVSLLTLCLQHSIHTAFLGQSSSSGHSSLVYQSPPLLPFLDFPHVQASSAHAYDLYNVIASSAPSTSTTEAKDGHVTQFKANLVRKCIFFFSINISSDTIHSMLHQTLISTDFSKNGSFYFYYASGNVDL